MIFKRVVANLRGQNWSAIAIELAIVVIGVFLGNQVSNWNEARLERAETMHVLRGLEPELRNMAGNIEMVSDYYRITRAYGEVAFAGWRGDHGVSDREFVIAAYQASQNLYMGINTASWSEIFGGDRLRTLDDQKLRDRLSSLMTSDSTAMEREVFTPYREDVRKVIPEDIQDAIRAHCGDRRFTSGAVLLPRRCTLDLPAERFAAAAADLRTHPELVGELRWHFAAVAAYVEYIDGLSDLARETLPEITKVR